MVDDFSINNIHPNLPYLRRSFRIQIPTQEYLNSVSQKCLDFTHYEGQSSWYLLESLDSIDLLTSENYIHQNIAYNVYYEVLHQKHYRIQHDLAQLMSFPTENGDTLHYG